MFEATRLSTRAPSLFGWLAALSLLLSPPAWSDTGLMVGQYEVHAETEGSFDVLRLTVFESLSGDVDPDPSAPETMPTLVLDAYADDQLVHQLVVDEALWAPIAAYIELSNGDGDGGGDAGDGGDFGAGDGSGGDSSEATQAAQQAIFAAFAEALGTQSPDFLTEAAAAVDVGKIDTVFSLTESDGCTSRWNAVEGAWMFSKILHMSLLSALSTFCTSDVGIVPPGPAQCVAGVVAWVAGLTALVTAAGTGISTKNHFNSHLRLVDEDNVGEQLNALSHNAAAIARDAKVAHYYSEKTPFWLATAAASVGFIYFSNPLAWRIGLIAAAEISVIARTGVLWGQYQSCMRRVIAPRLEASTVRVRPQLYHKDDGWVWVDLGDDPFLTSVPRAHAREVPLVFNADTLHAQDPGWINQGPMGQQGQALTGRMCYAVVIGADPDELVLTQNRNTRYWVGDERTDDPKTSQWWRGIRKKSTKLFGPRSARGWHRACEPDNGVACVGDVGDCMDNDNDGLLDEALNGPCNDTSNDPMGQEEADDLLREIHADVTGESDWSVQDQDYICSRPYALDLVSEHGLTGRRVRQEFVVNVGSAWTDAKTGAFLDPHAQASSQIRVLLRDSNWGEPRPHGCFSWMGDEDGWVRTNDAPWCDGVDGGAGGGGDGGSGDGGPGM